MFFLHKFLKLTTVATWCCTQLTCVHGLQC